MALSRLYALPDDRVQLRLRNVWDDGTETVEFSALEFVGRLAAQVPPKGQHLIRYHGVFAPASKLRSAIVPVLRRRADVPEVYLDRPRRRWIAWGELILRVLFQPASSKTLTPAQAAAAGCVRWRWCWRRAATCCAGWTTSALPRAAWFCSGRGRAETHRRRRRFGDGARRGRTSTGSYDGLTAKA